jgi:hypothetical protein
MQKPLLALSVAFAFSSLAIAGPQPKGWITKGPKENLERVHRATGLSCSSELLPEMMLRNFGAAKSFAPGKPFCEYERSGDVVRVYVLGRSVAGQDAIPAMVDDVRHGALAQQGYPVLEVMDVKYADSATHWLGVAFDLSKGTSNTPNVAATSFAAINGWNVRLDIDYKVTNFNDPGPKSQEAELRDAMAYLLAATLKKPR